MRKGSDEERGHDQSASQQRRERCDPKNENQAPRMMDEHADLDGVDNSKAHPNDAPRPTRMGP